MILKELQIRNFRSYYGENIFQFKDGLTLIIGGNGDGKTTLFDALDWLFKTGIEDKSPKNVSEMRASELGGGQSDELSVILLFEHDGDKILEKRFRFEKDDRGSIFIRDYSFQGYEIVGSERQPIHGNVLLERCFDAAVRKYCLFKGESELNVFENDTALKTLVDKFSDIRRFDNFVEMATEFEQKSDDAHKKELRSDSKVAKRAKELDSALQEVNRHLIDTQNDIKQQEAMAADYKTRVEILERNQEASEKYHDIKERIKVQEEKRSRVLSHIDEAYNNHLLDDMWILCAFPFVFKEYRQKVSALSREKRELNEKFIEARGKEKGKQEAIKELTSLSNGAARLPWDLPDIQTMQEMLDDEICKVCGRPATKDSEAYRFMQEKLDEYLRQEDNKKKEDEPEAQLFEGRNIEDLHNLSISLGGSTAQEVARRGEDIRHHIEFVATRKQELADIEEKIREAEDEKQRLLIQSDGLSEDMLDKSFRDLRGYFEQKNRAEQRVGELRRQEAKLLEEKNAIKVELDELNPDSSIARTYSKVHTVFEKIMKAFESAKKTNLRKFLNDLEKRANDYLEMLNVDDFHGEIHIRETANESAAIQLISSNGAYIHEPNGALKTTMYMSVLFAISDLTTLKREVDYPLIFDAPTSSFESFKEDEFYNVIDKINKQCIIVTKDLLDKDENTGERRLNSNKINRLTCSVYRIEKYRPFDPNDLATIRTTSNLIK
jgi:DNA sulfur modification protein DndD